MVGVFEKFTLISATLTHISALLGALITTGSNETCADVDR